MENFLSSYWWIILVIVFWELIWKALSLWKSARKNDKVWFVALLVLNTLGILEILYIFVFSKREPVKKAQD